MNALNELRAGLCSVAKRSVGLMSACGNEESTKLYLVLPIVGLFGYDYSNPYEVYPQHTANSDPKEPNRVDLAVLREGSPVIAIAAKKVGTDLAEARGELRRLLQRRVHHQARHSHQRHRVRVLRGLRAAQRAGR